MTLALALLVGHMIGDHLLQTDHQAIHKQQPGAVGWWAMAGHVTGYTLAQALVLAGICATGASVTLAGAAVALVISAVTHAVIDRGPLLRRLAHLTRTVRYHSTPAGRAAQDQALHAVAMAAAVAIGAGM